MKKACYLFGNGGKGKKQHNFPHFIFFRIFAKQKFLYQFLIKDR